jgi:hypothetical protein
MSDVIERISRSATIALLLSPVGLLLIAATRLLIISNYNSVTATAIASSQGYINTLLGTIIPIVPIFMPYLALLLLFSERFIAGILAIVATVSISPSSISRAEMLMIAKADWHLISAATGAREVMLIAIGTIFASLLLVEVVGLNFTNLIRTIGIVASIALIPIIVRMYPLPIKDSVYESPITQPWLPAEVITLTSRQAIVGYELSSDGYWFEALTAYSREIEHYRTSDILTIEICQMSKPGENRPIIALMPVHAPTPQCPLPTGVVKSTPDWLLPFFRMKSSTAGSRSTCMMPVPAVCQPSRKLSK